MGPLSHEFHDIMTDGWDINGPWDFHVDGQAAVIILRTTPYLSDLPVFLDHVRMCLSDGALVVVDFI